MFLFSQSTWPLWQRVRPRPNVIACLMLLCINLDTAFSISIPSVSWANTEEAGTAAFARLNQPTRRGSQLQGPHLNEHTCPLLGPAFTKPRHLDPDLLRPYAESFTSALENALAGEDNPYGDFDNMTNSFSLALWSTASNNSLFEYHFDAPELDRGNETLNNETIYRMGSISKVFTVYAYLATIGEAHLDEPITDFVPELAQIDAENAQDSKSNDVDTIRWSEITPRALAAQLSGLPRDYGLGEVSTLGFEDEELSMSGFPPLDTVTEPFCFPFTIGQNTECSRDEFFQGIRGWHPVSTPFTTPSYSNPNFGILAWALEAIVADGRNFTQILQDNVVSPLGLSRTFLHMSPDTDVSNVMNPFDANVSDWFLTGSFDNPSGNYYSTISDMNAFGRSILRSSLIPRQLTNQWLKPVTRTSATNQHVGMPWEIFSFEVPVSADSSSTRLVEMYAKAGDNDLHHSMMVLVPDYDIGFTVFSAGGATASVVRLYLVEMMRDYFLPAMEELAANEAANSFAGTYVDESTNSSVTVALRDDRIGLGLDKWTSRGIEMLNGDDSGFKGLFVQPSIKGTAEVRLQPMGLVDDKGGRLAFRMVTKDSETPEGFLFGCFTWANVGSYMYGNVGIDEVAFEVDEDGMATAIDMRAYRTVLKRSSTD